MDAPVPVRGSLFPCRVTGPDGTVWFPCRVVSAPEGTTVWRWSKEAHSGVAEFASPHAVIREAANSPNLTLTLDPSEAWPEGATISLVKDSGCGCGHPLRRWQPPGPARAGT